jgi:hypothetical protein
MLTTGINSKSKTLPLKFETLPESFVNLQFFQVFLEGLS